MVKNLRCQRCGKEWEYKGKSKYFTSCPQCKTSVKVTKLKMDKGVYGGDPIAMALIKKLQKEVDDLKRKNKSKGGKS